MLQTIKQTFCYLMAWVLLNLAHTILNGGVCTQTSILLDKQNIYILLLPNSSPYSITNVNIFWIIPFFQFKMWYSHHPQFRSSRLPVKHPCLQDYSFQWILYTQAYLGDSIADSTPDHRNKANITRKGVTWIFVSHCIQKLHLHYAIVCEVYNSIMSKNKILRSIST